MSLIVQKFGGSSVRDAQRIRNVAGIIAETYLEGNDVLVVLSAQGDTTDDLIAKAEEINSHPSKREMDMLLATGEQISVALCAMALESMGLPCVSLTAWQVGIQTTAVHGDARIKRIDSERVQAELDQHRIVLITGFQGMDRAGDVTTLGRGGSDTSAVALAAAFRAKLCQIYTDVDGVYTADPRIVPNAIKLDEITFAEMLELARLGAGVMQPRAVEYGEHNGVAIHVRSTFHEVPGTIIRGEYTVQEKKFVIRGVAHDTNVAKLAARGVPDEPGVAYRIFAALADANIDVDMIVQSASVQKDKNDILFTVAKTDMAEALGVLENLKAAMPFDKVDLEVNVAKVSIVGAGMLGSPGIAAGMFGALAEAGINIGVISTSEISISCLVPEQKVAQAVNAIHSRFFPQEAEN